MVSEIEYIIKRVEELNPLHSKKLKRNLKSTSQEYDNRASSFFRKYIQLLNEQGKDLDYAVDCYLKMIADVNFESVKFFETGQYSSKSFDEVNARVYGNPEIMTYYMHGLLMSQFLWVHHFDILLYFNKLIQKNKNNIHNYLEVGGGHGLYILEAIQLLGDNHRFDLVDISESSLNIAKKMIGNSNVNYILSDIYKYSPDVKYDLITMGEVLEHVEDAVGLLVKLRSLINKDGKIYITTPTNAPAIDHIYLFRNPEEIRKVIHDAGLIIEEELIIPSENVPIEMAEQLKVSLMYVGLLSIKEK